MSALRAVWPILDDGLTMRDAIALATPELDDIAQRAHARIVGTPRWSLRDGTEVPGSGHDGLVLVCDAPAVPAGRGAA